MSRRRVEEAPARAEVAPARAGREEAAPGVKERPGGAAEAGRTSRAAQPARFVTIGAHEHQLEGAAREQYAPGQLVVKCTEDVVAGVPEVSTARVASLRELRLPRAADEPFAWLAQRGLIREVVPIFSRTTRGRSLSVAPTSVAASFAMSVRDSESDDLRGLNLLRLEPDADLKQLEKDIDASPGVEYAHRVPRLWMAAQRRLPRDPLAPQQWGLRSVNWFGLDPLPDASAVKVAVLDTGVDLTHPDLRDLIQTYIHEGVAGDDVIGHGTHVAGILTARINNNVGIAGLCQCDLSVWKIFDDQPDPEDGEYYVDEVLYQRALNDVRRSGMRVVNLSIGGTLRSRTHETLFRRLVSSGAVVVAAMGNEYKQGNPTEYPAAYPGVIAVGATGKTNRRAATSNTGRHIALAAPGLNILSTLPMKRSAARRPDETRYAFWSGTSMATPHVAAAAALLLARRPDLSPSQVAEALTSTATKLAAMNGRSFTPEFGHGLLNIGMAVT